jgi:diguanylate cyclase (GGDEF)-like protein/putative nucleotidyltransferase with HDIG domain
VVVGVTLAFAVRHAESGRADRETLTNATRAQQALRRELELTEAALFEARAALMDDNPADRAQLARVAAQRVAIGRSLLAVTWSPVVRAGERAAFERQIGRPITTVQGVGRPVAPPRDLYVPLRAGYGLPGETLVGTDEASVPSLAAALEAARALRGISAAGDDLPIGLGGALAVRLYLPVFSEPGNSGSLRGYVGAIVGVDALRGAVEGAVPPGVPVGFDSDGSPAGVASPGGGPRVDRPAQIGGRRMEVSVATVPPSPVRFWLIAGVSGVLALLVLTVGIERGRRRAVARRLADQRRQADEHRALRRVATAVAGEVSADTLFAVAAEEAARLLGGQVGAVVRFDAEDEGSLAGLWSSPDLEPEVTHPPLTHVPLRDATAVAGVALTGRPARSSGFVASNEVIDLLAARNLSEGVASPVRVAGRLWGAIGVYGRTGMSFPSEAEERLSHFCELVEMALASADARSRLAEQAATDPLTGLPNRRVFNERLREEVARARRYGRPLSLVLIDLDHFKQINDGLGHETGDRVLRGVAARLSALGRNVDLLARIGGEEFAWILPETSGIEAYAVAERARQAVAGASHPDLAPLTLSAGVCDLTQAEDADDLFRLADSALYWAKSHGRNVAFRYTPEVVEALSHEQRAEMDERARSLDALRSLARAVDARGPGTRGHAERVAALAAEIAAERGWDPDRVAALHEAGLLHDVGKMGVPEAVLAAAEPLTPEERSELARHAPLGAEMVRQVLSTEQAAWIRAHHERVDGHGSPDGRCADDIPEGARILAVAEHLDVLLAGRGERGPMPSEAALRACAEDAGTRFDPGVLASAGAVLAAREPTAPSPAQG